jgi:hypothetical protein
VGFAGEGAYALLAGFLAGAAGGLASTGLALLALARNPALRGRLPASVSPSTVGIVAVNAMLFAWTLVGLLLGALYPRAGMPAFALAIAVAALALLAGAVFVRRRLTWPMWGTAAIAVLAFGGMLPALVALR